MNSLILIGMPGGPEIILIFLLILLLFGGRKIPELMRGLGKGIREFNSARASVESEIKEGMRDAERKEQEEQKRLSEQQNTAQPYQQPQKEEQNPPSNKEA